MMMMREGEEVHDQKRDEGETDTRPSCHSTCDGKLVSAGTRLLSLVFVSSTLSVSLGRTMGLEIPEGWYHFGPLAGAH